MTSPLLDPLSPEQRAGYAREVVTFRNRLEETGLFSDEALARLLDIHPRESLDIITMGADLTDRSSWSAGEGVGLTGAELLEAAKRGRIWLNVRRAMNTHPEYKAAFDRLLAEFQAQTGTKILRASGGILISAPKCQVFYHCDPSDTMLWHVRGVKTMYLYPAADPYLAERDCEAVLLKETLEDIPYSPELEAGAQAITLQPGMGVAWPLHWPHRVVNGDSFNVSVTIEYTTVRSMLTNGVFYVNGRLRRSLGLNPKSRGTPDWLKPAYYAVSKVLQKVAPPKTNALKTHGRRFDVDLNAPDCIVWRPGFGPEAKLKQAA